MNKTKAKLTHNLTFYLAKQNGELYKHHKPNMMRRLPTGTIVNVDSIDKDNGDLDLSVKLSEKVDTDNDFCYPVKWRGGLFKTGTNKNCAEILTSKSL